MYQELFRNAIHRYVSPNDAEEVLKLDDSQLENSRKNVSILFCGIRHHTTLVERLQEEELIGLLDQYYEAMRTAVFTHQGSISRYTNNGIMAVFGSPLPRKDHAWEAVLSSLQMRHWLQEFNAYRVAESKEPIQIGIGIHSGSVMGGNISSIKRIDFTVVGDTVNLSESLESVSEHYGCDIIISNNTCLFCTDQIRVRELDKIIVQGRTQPVEIYELVGLTSDPIPAKKERIIELYHRGRELYLERNFALAIGEFAQVLAIDRSNKAADLHMQRCQHWLMMPPPDDWDGVWTMTQK